MATNEVEEIPMTGDRDTTTEEETGDQETNIDDDDEWFEAYDHVVDESELLHSKRYMELLFTSSDEKRGDLAGSTVWKMVRLKKLEFTEIRLDKVFGREFRGSFGPANVELLKSLELTKNGLRFTDLSVTPEAGKKVNYIDVIVSDGKGGLRLSKSKIPGRFAKFNKLMERAKVESDQKSVRARITRIQEETVEGEKESTDKDASTSVNEGASTSVNEGASISDAPTVTREATDEIIKLTTEKLLDQMRILREKIVANMEEIPKFEGIKIEGENIKREVIPVIDIQLIKNEAMENLDEKFETFDTQIRHWEKLSLREDLTPELKELFKDIAEFEGLAKDFVKLEVHMTPEMEKTLGILREKVAASDWLRYERFKKWAKENLLGLSTGAVTVAAFITSIVAAARDAIKVAAKGLGRFAKSVANVLKKMGPIFSALGDIVSTALSFGAKGVEFLASNLWILAIAVAYALYNGYISRRNTPTPQIPYQNYPETQQTGPRRVRNRLRNYM